VLSLRRGSILAFAGIAVIAWLGKAAAREKPLPVAAPILVSSPYRFEEDALGRNETLSHVFGRHNIYGPQLVEVLNAADGLQPTRVRPGEKFEFKYLTTDSIPIEISHRLRNADEFLILRRDSASRWRGLREEIVWTISTLRVSGSISSSLWNSLPDAIPDSLLPARERNRLFINLTDDVYGWEIDFAYDIREGDGFNILFERLESSEGDVRYGRLLAADIETGGREHRTYLLPGDGANQYYDTRGRSMRRAFLRAPVSARVSSRFSLSRVHPVLRVRRAHRGTDYAARAGSPIRATADGTVISAGRDRGYGIVVKIRHASGIETRYAHMSRMARRISPGARVSQEQIIGYVGMTGLATAPHVHYEFIKNGRYLNPGRADLGDGRPIPEQRREEFEGVKRELDLILDGGSPHSISTP
jgi:Peptidase family M23/Csd3 second domain